MYNQISNFQKLIFLAFIAMYLTACGGGGSTGNHSQVNGSVSESSHAASQSRSSSSSSVYDIETQGIPKFVKTNYIDLNKISRISKFRSGQGHDYSDSHERCRSMKHYFAFPDETTDIYSPVAGKITRLDQEWAGIQIHIQSDLYPDLTFIIFHVNTVPLKVGDSVTEGQALGKHIGKQTGSDIAVAIGLGETRRLISYFDTLTDEAFSAFEQRSVSRREQFIISKADRDASPLQCDGEAFVGEDPIFEQWILLNEPNK